MQPTPQADIRPQQAKSRIADLVAADTLETRYKKLRAIRTVEETGRITQGHSLGGQVCQ